VPTQRGKNLDARRLGLRDLRDPARPARPDEKFGDGLER
jgi:hypothetical protein